MNRKEMIETIAKQAGCSKRLVRKKLFQISARFKREYKTTLFNRAFLNKSTDWKDFQDLYNDWIKDKENVISPWRVTNQFEVIYFPSGCNVMFKVDELYDGEILEALGDCGARLYNY